MITVLDIRTLSFATVVVAVLYGVAAFLFGSRQSRFKGFSYFGASFLALGLGFLGIGFRDVIPDAISIVLANTLIFASFAFTSQGIHLLISGRRRHTLIMAALVAVGACLFIYFTYFREDLAARVVVVNTAIIIASVFCILPLLRNRRREMMAPAITTVVAFLVNAGYSLFRIIWTLVEQTNGSFMTAGMVHGWAFITMDVYVLGSAFGYVWIASRFLQSELEEQARRDPLTEALNRRALTIEVEKERARFRRTGSSFSVIIFDLDFFKRLNDRFGHQAGDAVLVDVCNFVRNILREQDSLARFGGEEFLILLPDTGKSAVLEVAERLRAGLEQHDISVERAGKLRVAASFGIGTYDEDGRSWDDLIKSTDKALYLAKQQGRNRVVPAS